MSKNKSKFNNRAAKRFNDLAKIETMPQDEIFDILFGDIETIMSQFTDYRNHKPNSSFPNYMGNAFANLSTALFFYKFVKSQVKVKKGKVKTDLTKDEVESLRMIIADAYKKSVTNFFQNQQLDHDDRMKLLGKTFKILSPKLYKLTGKLEGLTNSQRRSLAIQVYGDPVHNFKYIHKVFNNSVIPEKKKIKLLMEMYGKRFPKAIGAALTVDSNASECIAAIFSYVDKLKKRRRAPFIKAYAEAYKKNKTRYFQINQEFVDRNKPIIRELRKMDIGFKKAFNIKMMKAGRKEKKP